MSFATPADVEARWPPGVPLPAPEVLQTWLDDAETLLRARYPNLDELVDAGGDTARQAVVLVETRMVTRALSNPRGVVHETIGDTAVTYRTDAALGFGLLEPDENLLDDLFGVSGGGLVSVPLSRDFGEVDWPFDWWQRDLEDPP